MSWLKIFQRTNSNKYIQLAEKAWNEINGVVLQNIEKEIPDIPINSIEVYVFASFFVSETYATAKVKQHKKELLDQIREKINEKALSLAISSVAVHSSTVSNSEIEVLANEFIQLLQIRYPKYKQVFLRNLETFLKKQETLFMYDLLELLFKFTYEKTQKPSDDKLASILIQVSVCLVQTFTLYMQAFKKLP